MAFRNRGLIKQARGDFEGGFSDIERAVQLDPKNADALNSRGALFHRNGKDLDRALADYEAAIRANPKFSKAYRNRAIIRQGRGDIEGALSDLSAAIALDAKDVEALINRGVFYEYERKDMDLAFADYESAIRMDPKSVSAITKRGAIKWARGDLDGAIADYDEAIRLTPNDAPVLVSRANLYRRVGNLTKASEDMLRAFELAPANEDVLWLRAYVLYDLQKWPEALGAFHDLAKAATSQQEWLPLRIWAIRARLGEGIPAGDELRTFLSIKPSQGVRLAADIGRFLIGELSEADLLVVAVSPDKREGNADLCDSYYYIGIRHLLIGDIEGARLFLTKCRETECVRFYSWSSAGAELLSLK